MTFPLLLAIKAGINPIRNANGDICISSLPIINNKPKHIIIDGVPL